MIEGIDIWRAAQQMRNMFGENAVLQSAKRADGRG